MMSKRILPMKIRTKWIAHAPAFPQLAVLLVYVDCPTWTALRVQRHARVEALTLRIHPLGVEVGQGSLVAQLLQGLGWFFVDKTTATPPPGLLCVEGHVVAAVRGGAVRAQSVGPRVASEAQAGGAIEEYGRQFGGGRGWLGYGQRGCSRRVRAARNLCDRQQGSGRGGRSGSYCVRTTSRLGGLPEIPGGSGSANGGEGYRDGDALQRDACAKKGGFKGGKAAA